jgi:hypothetical protein
MPGRFLAVISLTVMAGLVPAIHVLILGKHEEDVDARHEAGHDVSGGAVRFGGNAGCFSVCGISPASSSL